MLVHVVLMRLQPGVPETALIELAERIRALAATIAGPGTCVVGTNVTEEPLSQDYAFGFALTFASHAELDAYHVNPAHLPVSLAIRALSNSVLVFDFAA